MKKFRFLKLLGFVPLITVPLIAAGCNGYNGTGLLPGQKSIGDYVMKFITRLEKPANYVINGAQPQGLNVYQVNDKNVVFNSTAAFNFINTNGNPKTEGDVTTYKFMGNTGEFAENVIPFAKVIITSGEETYKFNVSISFTINLKDNTVEKNSLIKLDIRSSAVEFYSRYISNAAKQNKDELKPTDVTALEKFFAKTNLVNAYNWMYAAPVTGEARGGATEKDGVVKFPVTTVPKKQTPPASDFNLPARSELPLPDAKTTALVKNFIVSGWLTFDKDNKGILGFKESSRPAISVY